MAAPSILRVARIVNGTYLASPSEGTGHGGCPILTAVGKIKWSLFGVSGPRWGDAHAWRRGETDGVVHPHFENETENNQNNNPNNNSNDAAAQRSVAKGFNDGDSHFLRGRLATRELPWAKTAGSRGALGVRVPVHLTMFVWVDGIVVAASPDAGATAAAPAPTPDAVVERISKSAALAALTQLKGAVRRHDPANPILLSSLEDQNGNLAWTIVPRLAREVLGVLGAAAPQRQSSADATERLDNDGKAGGHDPDTLCAELVALLTGEI
jgi:hypothetical protein